MKKILPRPTLIFSVFFLLCSTDVRAQLPIPEDSDAEEISDEGMTEKILRNVDVGKIDKDDLTIDDLVDLIERKTKGAGYPVSFSMEQKLRKRKIILNIDVVSAFTLTMIIKENLAYGDFKIVGDRVIFPKLDQ